MLKKVSAPQMEPAFEALLRQVNLNEELIWAFRNQDICDRGVSIALDSSEDGIRLACTQGFGIAPIGAGHKFAHRRDGQDHHSMQHCRVPAKLRVDAVAKARGEPTSMLQTDWTSVMEEFRKKFGGNLLESNQLTFVTEQHNGQNSRDRRAFMWFHAWSFRLQGDIVCRCQRPSAASVGSARS